MKNPILNRILLVVSILGILFFTVYGLYSFTDFWRGWLPERQTGSAGSSKKPAPSIFPEIAISPSTQSLSYSPVKPIDENFQEFILEGFLVKVEEDAILIQAGKMQKFYRFTEPKIILLSKNYNLGSQVRVVLQRKESDQLEAIEMSLVK